MSKCSRIENTVSIFAQHSSKNGDFSPVDTLTNIWDLPVTNKLHEVSVSFDQVIFYMQWSWVQLGLVTLCNKVHAHVCMRLNPTSSNSAVKAIECTPDRFWWQSLTSPLIVLPLVKWLNWVLWIQVKSLIYGPNLTWVCHCSVAVWCGQYPADFSAR